jgi:ADP-heptose:LPS heptosyltransferase
MIQTSSVLPGLKRQGFHVCVNTTPKGLDVLRNDPNIDEFLIQQDNQVPPKELDDFWFQIYNSFEKHINLSESVEGSLLALQGRHQWNWPKEFRDMVMNVDYLVGMHAIAGVPNSPAPRFYTNSKERKWAKTFRDKLGRKNFTIMWSVAGSSVHKIYPHMDEVIHQTLVEHPDVRFILVGDELSKIGEVNFESHPKVVCKSGRWEIRETLSMALECDMVIGPETGILNVVSFESMPKGLILSHSSKKNIGGSWKNTKVFEPQNTECYPCHKLHFGFDTCNRDEISGCAACAASINPAYITEEIMRQKISRSLKRAA